MPSSPIISTISIEGGLFPSNFLARLACFDEQLDQLNPAAYGCLPGETLRDTITDAWNRMQRVWALFQAHRASAPAEGDATGDTRQRWLLPFFQVLGYQDLERAPAPEIDGKTYRLSHLYRHVPIHLIGHRLDLDKRVAGTAGVAASNAHGLVQEFLNRSPAHQWGIVSNGLRLRLLRDNASLTRQAYLEVDLEALFDQHARHDFVQVWLLLHASRFQPAAAASSGQPSETIIDRWYATGTKEGVRALDRLRHNVQAAIEHLGRGFLTSSGPGNRALREALAGDRLKAQDYYRELLRTVYRLLFCFVAEDRDVLLLPTATAVQRDRYVRWYATSRLRRLAASRAGTPHGDGWQSLQLIFRWLSSDTGCPTLGVPALGSLLWSTEATPHLDSCNLSNQALFAALRALAVTTDGGVRRAIDFKNLGAEELGGIYESLLELHPELNTDSGAFSLKSVAGSERKTTGSYYTPTSLIKCLLDSALDPVLEVAANKPTAAEAERAILDLTVVDPACGSGHFLVAAGHRMAKRLASVRTGDLEPAPEAIRHALRDVISRCIYGVDLNPMSVELCKVSLWLEAIDPGRPLSFLDHRIRCGNSLIGATPELIANGVPDEAFDPITGDDKDTCKERKKRNKSERAAMETRQASLFSVLAQNTGAPLDDLRRREDATLADVARLREAWELVENDPTQQRVKWAADAWVAAFLVPKTPGSPTVTSEAVRVALQAGPSGLDPQQRVVIQQMTEEYRVFHWHVAFPELFGDGRTNGFSVVLGNPPWEHTELKEIEWFTSRDEQIANAGTGAERKRRIAALERENPNLWRAFCDTLRHHTAIGTYAGSSGRYPLCGRGRINTYAVFSELILGMVNGNGRAGFIVPTGIATDDGNKFYFQHLVDGKRLVSFYDFENRQGIFEGVHRSYKFALLTIAGAAAQIPVASFVFFAQGIADLADQDRRISLSPEDIACINPNTRTCPIFRTRRDAEITKSIYQRVPILIRQARDGQPEENPWGVTFRQGLFNMTSDSHLFTTRTELEADGWVLQGNLFHKGPQRMLPLYEAKMFHHYDHRWATYEGEETKDLTDTEKDDPCCVALPRYWVASHEVDQVLSPLGQESSTWFLAFRDIARSTDERTALFAAIPKAAVGNKAPLVLVDQSKKCLASMLQAMLSSFALDFVARQKIGGTTANFFLVYQFPVLPPEKVTRPLWGNQSLADALANHVVELTCTAGDLDGYAREYGHAGEQFRWNPTRRSQLRAELDAAFFHLYDLNRDDASYILDTFPIVKRKDEAQYNEYRTKNLILEAYDAMADAIRTGRQFQTKLDPPPADPRCAHGYTPPAVPVSLPAPLAVPATLDDWARATVIAASLDQPNQSIKRLRLTQFLLGRPALVAQVVSGTNLGLPSSASAPAATSNDLRQAITRSFEWAELTVVLQRQGNDIVNHGVDFDQACLSRPWLATLWPPATVALARQVAEAAERLLDEITAGRLVTADPSLIRELQAVAA